MPRDALVMAKKPNVWVVKDPDGGWNTKQGGEELSHHRLQSRAIDEGETEAIKDKVDLVIQGRDGKIRSKDSYGPDPNPPKDKEN